MTSDHPNGGEASKIALKAWGRDRRTERFRVSVHGNQRIAPSGRDWTRHGSVKVRPTRLPSRAQPPRMVGLLVLLWVAIAGACSGTHAPVAGADKIEDVLRSNARVLWVAAHPDDEALAGSVLAHACVGLRAPCHFLVFNHGEGGECLLPEGCHPDLGTVRGHELEESAALYGAELEHYRFWNAPLPVESFPAREQIAAKWRAEGDPGWLVAAAIRRFRPTVVLTLDADHGFTCHPEHQLAARFAMEGIRRAADGAQSVDDLPTWKTPHYFEILNRYWFLAGIMGRDPAPYTDTIDPDQGCAPAESCIEMAGRFSHAHRTQAGDMGHLRALNHLVWSVYLRRMDPFTSLLDPLEPAPNTCG